MKKLLIILVPFVSCYTELKKPDYDFMKRIKEQAGLAPTLKTQIELKPATYFFGEKKNSEHPTGFFYIKNIGKTIFSPVSIQSNCNCIIVDYPSKEILPNDSMMVMYEVNIKNSSGLISNSIVVIGNCQYGNQTFYLEGTIINK